MKKGRSKSKKYRRGGYTPEEARVKTVLHSPEAKADHLTSAILTQGNFVKPNRVGVRQLRDGS